MWVDIPKMDQQILAPKDQPKEFFTGSGEQSRLFSIAMIEDLLQPRHLLVILAVALFLFGPKKLPELGKGLAEGIRGFKEALKPGTRDSA